MNIARIFSKERPPINRWIYTFAAIMLVSSLSDLAGSWTSQNRAYLVFDSLFPLICVLVWPLFAIRRLIDIRRSLLWMVPISVPLAIPLLAVFCGWSSIVIRVSLAIALAIQLPLMLLPPRKDLDATQVEGAAESRP